MCAPKADMVHPGPIMDGINVISEGNQQFTTTYGHAFYNLEFNRAFVQMEHFGYLRRDPDAADTRSG